MPDIMDTMDIAFPHLGIYLENVPKSFSIFGFTIAMYGVMIGLAMVCGLLMAEQIARREGADPDLIWEFGFFSAFLGIVGARLYYVFFSWDKYKDDLLSIFNLRQGGLAIYGGVIAGFATFFICCRVKKVSFFKMADCGVFGLILGQIIGRWGNFFNREAFGTYTDSLFAMRLPTAAVRASEIDEAHTAGMAAMGDVNFIQVHPTFLYEGTWNLCLLVLMCIFRKHKKYDGQMCLMYLGGYGIGRFWIEGLRTDSLLIPNTQIAVSQLLGILMFIAACIADCVIRARQRRKEQAS